MVKSVLDAIREGLWDFEPADIDGARFTSTKAMPGTAEKLEVLAARLAQGLPLWHGGDCKEYDDPRRQEPKIEA